jgi:hypothetical protein
MSTRTFVVPISSVEPLRAVIGSKDAKLEKALIDDINKHAKKAYGTIDPEEMDDWDRDEYEESLESIQKLFARKAAVEPGSWVYALCNIAERLKLVVKLKHPFVNHDWKHAWVWDEYIEHVEELAGKQAIKLLRFLANGRPLKGRSVDYDGCTFAWLTQAEMQLLHQSLDRIEVADDLSDFHDQLVGTFAACCKKGCDLFVGAS